MGRRLVMHLKRHLLIQSAVMLAVAIQLEKVIRLLLDCLAALQIGIFPYVFVVVLVKAFDIAIALRVTYRGKDQLRTDLQCQTHHFAQHVPMGKPTTEATLVIHLGIAGNP